MVLILGVLTSVVGFLALMPIPGNDNNHICLANENSDTFRSLAPIREIAERIKCSNISKVGCCDLEWCKEQSAMTVWQLVIGFAIFTMGHPFRISLTQSIFSKILGPVPQVNSSKYMHKM